VPKFCTGGGSNPCYKKIVNPQIPAGKPPHKVIFTCIQVSNISAGTQRHHLSQMEVMVSGGLTPQVSSAGGPMSQ